MQTSSRREFLGFCLGGLAVAGAAAVAYPILGYLAPVKTNESGDRISFAVTEIPPEGAKFFKFRGMTGVVIRKQSGEFVALSAICTHLGCVVQWEKEKQNFLCPCHGGRFTPDGTVISGPPPKPLERLPLVVADGVVTVG